MDWRKLARNTVIVIATIAELALRMLAFLLVFTANLVRTSLNRN